jgi:hypothetical protein
MKTIEAKQVLVINGEIFYLTKDGYKKVYRKGETKPKKLLYKI